MEDCSLASPACAGQKGTPVHGFPALNHVALTVRDMAVSGPWYRRLFDTNPVVDEHTAAGFRHLVWILDGGTLIGIHQHEHPAPNDRFSEFRVGLDHVGFGCANRAELETWMRDAIRVTEAQSSIDVRDFARSSRHSLGLLGERS